jgi:hypothetical protein
MCLNNLTDAELKDYLLQLVQVLKYEPNHISALACWLMRRALGNQIQLGHTFFWSLQAEMHVPEISERFGLMLEIYLRACGEQREELLKQMEVIKKLKMIAGIVKVVQRGLLPLLASLFLSHSHSHSLHLISLPLLSSSLDPSFDFDILSF